MAVLRRKITPAQRRRAVRKALAALGTKGGSSTDVARELPRFGDPLHQYTIRKYLKELRADGVVERLGQSRWRVVRYYR